MEDCSKSPIVVYTSAPYGPEKIRKEESDIFKTMDDVFDYTQNFVIILEILLFVRIVVMGLDTTYFVLVKMTK